MNTEDWIVLERKLFTVWDEGNMPELFRPLLLDDL
jgi:hypothetical protein